MSGAVLGIIALVRGSRGMGWSIAAIAVAAVGMVIALVMIFVTASIVTFSEESTVQELAVVETSFTRDGDRWNYVAIVDNSNADYIFPDASISIEALSEEGTILDTNSEWVTILSGDIALAGTFFDIGQAQIASIEVRGPNADYAVHSPAAETGVFTVSDVAAATDGYGTEVTGTVSGDFAEELRLLSVTVVARNPDGAIIGGEHTYIERLPVGGRVQFQATFFDPLPEGTTYTAYARL